MYCMMCVFTVFNCLHFCEINSYIYFCFFFCRYHLPAKCVMVSGTRQLAPVSGAGNRNRRQKMVNVSST